MNHLDLGERMTKGLFITIVASENGFLMSIFRLFHIGIVASGLLNSSGTTLTIGFWRFMTSLTLEYRTPFKVESDNAGIS